jgi:hypothetical protein
VRPPALILVTDRSLGGVSRGAVLAPSACAQVEEHQREEQEDERHPPYASQAERNGQAGGKHAGDKTGLVHAELLGSVVLSGFGVRFVGAAYKPHSYLSIIPYYKNSN